LHERKRVDPRRKPTIFGIPKSASSAGLDAQELRVCGQHSVLDDSLPAVRGCHCRGILAEPPPLDRILDEALDAFAI
jgi:hypothetical protein